MTKPQGPTRRQTFGYFAAGAAVAASPAIAEKPGSDWRMPATRKFSVIENEWIRLADGARLSARIWIPEGASAVPVGAVLEYLPYRARDVRREIDDKTGPVLAGHGFAFVRVDMRGSGDSDGVKYDEFEAVEWTDLDEIVAWIAKHPWCNGSVGMRGNSWGGNASLMGAVRNPPALKAVIASCASGDRFRKDLHFLGGAPAQSIWSALLKTVIAMPPDPSVFGPDWKKQWLTRLGGTSPVIAKWYSHQRADDYWARSSAALHYGNIRCAVYAVGGMEDGFTNEILDIAAEKGFPYKGLVGAWGHMWPNTGVPGPKHPDWDREEIRWWSQWLHGDETGIMDEPRLQVYLDDVAPREVAPADVPGRWVYETAWPSRGIKKQRLFLGRGRIAATAPASSREAVPFGKVVGRAWPEAVAYGNIESLAAEQSADDRNSLCFDGDVVTEPFDIVGRPRVEFRIQTDQPISLVAVRLTEVRPDGTSWPISWGVLNLPHRNDLARPELPVPGQFYDVAIDLKFATRRIPAGSHLRVAFSSSFWPILLPSPRPARLTIEGGSTATVSLPRRAPSLTDGAHLGPKTIAPVVRPTATTAKSPAGGSSGVIELVQVSPKPAQVVTGIGTTITGHLKQIVTVDQNDMSKFSYLAESETGLARDQWKTRTIATVKIEPIEGSLRITEVTTAYDGDEKIFEKSFVTDVPREFS